MKEEFRCYEPVFGQVHCYHCGDSYQVTPCSITMVNAILKQWGKDHKKCKETKAGVALLASVQSKVEAQWKEDPSSKNAIGLTLKPNATLGDKVAHHMEMEMLDKALKGDIPEQMKSDEKFMAALQALKDAGVTGIERD